MGNSRTKNSARNASVAAVTQIINVLITFITRTSFIFYLGKEYLSINGLFISLLSILSIAELGISDAIIYSLYKPISEDDKKKVTALVQLFQKAYRYIASAILVIGLILIPFLDLILKDTPNIDENIILIYLLFLANSVFSYTFAYKNSILKADQKNYIIHLIQQVMRIVQALVQVAILITTQNYVLFLIVQIIFTLAINLLIIRYANKNYPYINKNNEVELEEFEKKDIFISVKSIFFYKLGSVILTGTDNIIISRILNYILIGVSSNYQMIISAVNNIIMTAFLSIASSVGNLNTKNDSNNYRVFKQLLLLAFWGFGISSVSLVILSNDFIELWIGENYLFEKITVIALVSTFYINGVNVVTYTFRTTMGLFREARFTPILASVINISLSIFWGKKYGIHGIFFATTIARLFTFGTIDAVLIYKKRFNKKCLEYFLLYYKYIVFLLGITFLTDKVVGNIQIDSWLDLIIKAIITFVFSNLLLIIIVYRTVEFKEVIKKSLSLINKKIKE